jgi:hypothetical protein
MALEAKLPMDTPAAAQAADAEASARGSDLAPVWLQRMSLGVLVLFCLYLGGLLVYLPWWKEMWDHNSFLLGFPKVHHVLMQGPVRGLVSGIGLIDLWIGFSEIVHYREYRS